MTSEPEPNDPSEQPLVAEERRSSDRREVTTRAVMLLGGQAFEATVRNRSNEGLLVVIDEPIRVEIELGEGAARHTETALVRRVGTLPGGSFGIGLELVPDEPAE